MSEELQLKTELLLAENGKLLEVIASGEAEIARLSAELRSVTKQRDVFEEGFTRQTRAHEAAVAEKKRARLGPTTPQSVA